MEKNSEIIFLVCFYCRRSGGGQVLELHLPRAFLADHLRDPLQRHCLFGQGKRPEFTTTLLPLCWYDDDQYKEPKNNSKITWSWTNWKWPKRILAHGSFVLQYCHYSLLRQRTRPFTTRWFTSQPSSLTSCSRSSSFAGSRCTGPPRASHTCSHPRWTNCCCPQFGLTLQIRFHIMKEAPRWCKPDKSFPNWKSSRPNYAPTQVFYSFGLAFGSIISFGSYNNPAKNCVKDVIIITACNAFTAIYACAVIFSILGFKAVHLFEKCMAQ